jgi:uncharacterized protein
VPCSAYQKNSNEAEEVQLRKVTNVPSTQYAATAHTISYRSWLLLTSATKRRGDNSAMPISQSLLALLVCPQCHGTLINRETEKVLACNACRVAYPVRDDVPIMLVNETVSLEHDRGD